MKWFKPKNDTPSEVAAVRGRSEAVSDSVIWRDEAEGAPVARCLVHGQRLVPRDPETGELKNIAEAHRIGDTTPFGPWRLHCIASSPRDEHPVDLSESKSWDEAVRGARAKLQAVAARSLRHAS